MRRYRILVAAPLLVLAGLLGASYVMKGREIASLERERALLAQEIQQQEPTVEEAERLVLKAVLETTADSRAEIQPETMATLQKHARDVSRYERGRREIESVRSRPVLPPFFMRQQIVAQDPQDPQDALLREVAAIVRTPLPVNRIDPMPTGRDCENYLKVRKRINPDKYFEFYQKNWTLKGTAGKVASAEIGVEAHYVTGLDAFLLSQLVSARQVIDAYRTDCGIAGDILVHLGDRTARLGAAVYIITVRYQKASEAAKEAKKAAGESQERKDKEKLEESRESIRRGVTILIGL